jgi:hypothetical protein
MADLLLRLVLVLPGKPNAKVDASFRDDKVCRRKVIDSLSTSISRLKR